MTNQFWSFVLQWSRFGINAAVFLIAARFLSLEQIGLFATAYVPIRLMQGFHKAGVSEMVVIRRSTPRRLTALFGLSLVVGSVASAIIALIAWCISDPFLMALSIIPFASGCGAVSDGLLRKRLALRRLALRTFVVQILASLAFFIAFANGWATGALVLFALSNSVLTAGLNIVLAQWWPNSLPIKNDILLTLRKVMQIALRDFTNGAILPMAQLAVAASLGMAAAGAFQIASRILSMLDALTLSPLRYLALPNFAEARSRSELIRSLSLTNLIAGWVWFGALSAVPEILQFLAGDGPVKVTAPILMALLPLGLIGAVAMPFSQMLTAMGQTSLVLRRALLTGGLSAIGVTATVSISVTAPAVALSIASGVSLIWFIKRACVEIGVSYMVLLVTLWPLFSGAVMAVALVHLDVGLAAKIILGTTIYIVLVSIPRTRRLRSMSA